MEEEYMPKENTEQEQQTAEGTKKVNVVREIFSWVLVVVVAYVLAFCVTRFWIIKTEIISGSMIATLNIGDRVVGNRLAYTFSEPKRGDVIFFAYPEDESETYVKRIIGLPGETVVIRNGLIYINGSDTPLDEPYLYEEMLDPGGTYTVPEGSYFVLGDNRNISRDSREWGYVSFDEIYARAWFRYSPSIDLIKSARY